MIFFVIYVHMSNAIVIMTTICTYNTNTFEGSTGFVRKSHNFICPLELAANTSD